MKHTITVNDKTFGVSTMRCSCGEQKSFDRGQEARFYGERHARKAEAAEMAVLQDGEPLADRRSTRRHMPFLSRIAFHVNYDGTKTGIYS